MDVLRYLHRYQTEGPLQAGLKLCSLSSLSYGLFISLDLSVLSMPLKSSRTWMKRPIRSSSITSSSLGASKQLKGTSGCHLQTKNLDIFLLCSYERIGLPDCCGGSIDCMHLVWDKCHLGLSSMCKGKDKCPTLAFKVSASHTTKWILSVSQYVYGTINGKSISLADAVFDFFGRRVVSMIDNMNGLV